MKDNSRVPVYVSNLTVALAKLKTVHQKHIVMYLSSKSTHSQNRQVLKRIASVHLGAGGVHKTKAKIPHKYYLFWNSQSQIAACA